MRTSYDADTLCLQDILASENPQLRTESDRGGFFAAATEFFPGSTARWGDS